MLPVLEAERIYHFSQSVFIGQPPTTNDIQNHQNKLLNQLNQVINELDGPPELSELEFKSKLLSAGISIEEVGPQA